MCVRISLKLGVCISLKGSDLWDTMAQNKVLVCMVHSSNIGTLIFNSTYYMVSILCMYCMYVRMYVGTYVCGQMHVCMYIMWPDAQSDVI